MFTPRGSRLVPTLVCTALLGLTACEEPVTIGPGAQPQTIGGVTFAPGEYGARYLELDHQGQTVEYPRPVLTIPVTITNAGEDNVVYSPSHASQQMTEGSTPLLYPAPPAETPLAEFSKAPINGVYLDRGTLPGQVTATTTLAPGESLSDIFLFEIPDGSITDLVLSLPPSMHRGTNPVLFGLSYKATTPTGPTVYEVGQSIDVEGVSFEVTAVDQAYIKLKNSDEKEGYSDEPVLRVDYKLTNTTDSALTFDPGHRDLSGRQGARLHSTTGALNRVRLPSNTSAEGQLEREAELAPGASVTDFALFERPDQAQSLTFELAADHFARSGKVRVSIPFEPADVAQPEEMTKAQAEK
ncbi:hypothetical protein DL240_16330 [Lujinxingia litoralis]|uniref:DUF4352 domain-containing protein n=1 Tax=Lujinxingia litoralis TaxID=2211119 RepID=A0A328C1X6_9DELT|nr:hypothetical protein [Lujinxingia litoralis]RAL20597.1 hypothetical protein DL240_16330 [Lujinxingia litoralis]